MERKISEIVEIEDLTKVSGGDWFDVGAALMVGAALAAGTVASGGLLIVAAGAGVLLSEL